MAHRTLCIAERPGVSVDPSRLLRSGFGQPREGLRIRTGPCKQSIRVRRQQIEGFRDRIEPLIQGMDLVRSAGIEMPMGLLAETIEAQPLGVA